MCCGIIVHIPVYAGDLALATLVGSTDNGHNIVLADGDRADLSRIGQNRALSSQTGVVGFVFSNSSQLWWGGSIPREIVQEKTFKSESEGCRSLRGNWNIHCL